MAINVNTVYTTVLSILNKEQRGYITPDEFNKLATQVQLEMFENYFEDLNQQLRVPQTESEYADRRKNIDNNISIFKTIGNTTTVPAGRVTSLSLTNGGTGYTAANGVATTVAPVGGTGLTVNTSITIPTFTLTNGGTGYSNANNVATTGGAGTGLTVNITSVNSGVITGVNINTPGLNYVSGNVLTILGGGANAQITLTADSNGVISNVTINNGGSGYSVGDVITVSTGGANATATVQAVNSSLYFLPPSNLHRIGTVIYKDEKELQRVNRDELLHINMSPLTKPTTDFPIYIYEQSTQGVSGVNTGQPHIYVYPKTINNASDITVSYIRKPSDVVWGFTVGALNQYVYNKSASTQFELDSTEQNEVIIRILAYAGVVIRDPQIVQAAAQAVQSEEINSKS
tara:strand:+ start:1432 stop:2637 length:1206 start_codon:yes stop_codon:yes gene_type:complete